jgi:general stress protein 26
MKIEPSLTGELRHLGDQLESQRTAMLTVRDHAGRLTSRPMTVQMLDEHGTFWMLASRRSLNAVAGGADGSNACLAFSDEDDALFVSVSGQLHLDDSRERKGELWSTLARPWFPQGVDDPDLVCLGLRPVQADVWDGPDSGVVRALALAASVVAGRPIGLGERESTALRSTA